MIVVQTKKIEMNNSNLYDYIMNNYIRFFDLTPGRAMELNYVLGLCHANEIRLDDFKEIFGLNEEGFFGILKFVVDKNNLEKVVLYGNMCHNDALNQASSQTLGTVKGI